MSNKSVRVDARKGGPYRVEKGACLHHARRPLLRLLPLAALFLGRNLLQRPEHRFAQWDTLLGWNPTFVEQAAQQPLDALRCNDVRRQLPAVDEERAARCGTGWEQDVAAVARLVVLNPTLLGQDLDRELR